MIIVILRCVFLGMAALALLLTGCLFHLAMVDVMEARFKKINGAVQFMTWDNARHQGFVLVLSLLMLFVAVTIRPNPSRLIGLVILAIIPTGIFVDALFSFYRRRRMAELVGEFIGQPGGRRKTDPPIEVN